MEKSWNRIEMWLDFRKQNEKTYPKTRNGNNNCKEHEKENANERQEN